MNLTVALNQIRAVGVVGEDMHQSIGDFGLQRGRFQSVGQENDSGPGNWCSGFRALQADNRNAAGDARYGAASPRRNGAAEEEQHV